MPVIGSEKSEQKDKNTRVFHHGHKLLTIFEELLKLTDSIAAVEEKILPFSVFQTNPNCTLLIQSDVL